MQRFPPAQAVQFTSMFIGLVLAGHLYAQSVPLPASLNGNLGEVADVLTDSSAIPSGTAVSGVPPKVDGLEPAISPVVGSSEKKPGVNWRGLSKDSLTFLSVMQAFRYATEPGTRAALSNPFFKGYIRAVQNLHGFSDGDPFYVNYIGHPLQGSVASFIWENSDRSFQDVYFSDNRKYWKEKLRGAAYSFVYSVQFEIGPVSEASIGDMQSYYPAQGFVDHLVTPAFGMGWSIGEDAVDRYFIRRIEQRSTNPLLRGMTRALLNPARSFANLMGGKYPWNRNNRPGVHATLSAEYYSPVIKPQKVSPPPGAAPFEFKIESVMKTYVGANSAGSCWGGGGGIAFRMAEHWQIASEVNGCKITSLPAHVSGDSLTYVIGPRWSAQLSPRWITHAQFLMGGNKITQERVFPDQKRAVEQAMRELAKKGVDPWPPPYSEFARSWDSNAFVLVTGGGVELKFNHAFLLRTLFGYSRTWNRDINDISYRNSLQFSSGLVLNMGTW